MAKGTSKSPTPPLPPPARINVEDFTEAVFRGVLRAIEAQRAAVTKEGISRPLGIQKPGHIVYGVVYFPEDGETQAPASS